MRGQFDCAWFGEPGSFQKGGPSDPVGEIDVDLLIVVCPHDADVVAPNFKMFFGPNGIVSRQHCCAIEREFEAAKRSLMRRELIEPRANDVQFRSCRAEGRQGAPPKERAR